MIEFCAGCSEKHDDFRWLKNEEGWFCSKWYRRTGIKDKTLEEYIATPFWKITGQKPKPSDIAQEKWMKNHNLTYSDLRKKQIAESPIKYDSTELKKKLMKGELKTKPAPQYRKVKV
jgi:hypothetical protein